MADVIDSDVNCQRCGYNLRGLETHQRCPECGLAYSFDTAAPPALRPALGRFGRVCAGAAFVLGVAFLFFGTLGTFVGFGCRWNCRRCWGHSWR